jgi:type I restriction enzyme S subunit
MNVSTAGRIERAVMKYVDPSAGRHDIRLSSGDILFNNTNSPELVGKTALFEDDDSPAFSNHMTRLRVDGERLDAKYAALRLHHAWREGWFAARCNNHVSQASIGRDVLKDFELELPPLSMQRAIASFSAALDDSRTSASNHLSAARASVERFRQSVLAAACDGRLTVDWREMKGIEEDAGPPGRWVRRQVVELCAEIVDCPHSTPKWVESGEICIRTTNFQPGRLDLSEVRYVAESTFAARNRRLTPVEGDVLLSREGGILGIACLVPADVKICLGQRMMLMRSKADVCVPAFLMHALNGPGVQRLIAEMTGGTSSPHVNVGEVKRFEIDLPPLEEQQEIVGRVDTLLKRANELETRIDAATRSIGWSSQAFLAKAFRGDLVGLDSQEV